MRPLLRPIEVGEADARGRALFLGRVFGALHERGETFVMPSVWDERSARTFEQLAFPALRIPDNPSAVERGLSPFERRDRMFAQARRLAAGTKVPLSASCEDGFGDDAADVAETVRLAGQAGLVGCEIDDYAPDARAFRPRAQVAERIAAAAEAARALSFPFVLTAHARRPIRDARDLAKTIRQLEAFQEAGADVLFVSARCTLDDVARIVGALDRPLAVLGGAPGLAHSVAALAALGVCRVTMGTAVARTLPQRLTHVPRSPP